MIAISLCRPDSLLFVFAPRAERSLLLFAELTVVRVLSVHSSEHCSALNVWLLERVVLVGAGGSVDVVRSGGRSLVVYRISSTYNLSIDR